MSLEIIPKKISMSSEKKQLEEMVQHITEAKKGTTLLFPEYGAYTVSGSKEAYKILKKKTKENDVSVITSMNIGHKNLPCSKPKERFNLNLVFSRNGQVYAPQGKITPQSFEMEQLSKKSPEINVRAYKCLNKATLSQNGEEYTAFFLNCSDLYVMQMFTFNLLKADAIICPANFANGAEDAAAGVIDYAVKAGLFKKGFFSNIEQITRKDRKPLAIGVEKIFDYEGEKLQSYSKKDMKELIDNSSAIYEDKDFKSFHDMLQLTQNGTFTISRSRTLENDLKVERKRYRKVIYI